MKAWIYFQLITRYGGVPIINECYSLEDASSVTFTRNTLDECVTEIERLINEAIPALPQTYYTDNANFGRATQDVCRALLSRTYLYMASPLFNPSNDKAKWQKAADAAKNSWIRPVIPMSCILIMAKAQIDFRNIEQRVDLGS